MTSLLGLRSANEQLSKLVGIFQIPSQSIQSRQIRAAEKIVVSLGGFFNDELFQMAERWQNTQQALEVFNLRLEQLDKLTTLITEAEGEVALLEHNLEAWQQTSEAEQQKILHYGSLAKLYTQNRGFEAEAHIIHRYKRFDALKPLLPFVDHHEHLCEAIHHFLNRERYEENIRKLTEKKRDSEKRFKTVHRGFVFALCLCVFLVTVPLCLPFAISLWARRKEILKQIANSEESLKREERRLQSADEGVIAYEEITAILGNKSIDEIRSSLKELQDLRTEFQAPQQAQSATSNLLTFMELYQKKLTELFGGIPESIPEKFYWLSNNVANVTGIISQLNTYQAEAVRLKLLLQSLSKGYTKDTLIQNRDKLIFDQQNILPWPMSTELISEFLHACMRAKTSLEEVKKVFSLVVQGYVIPEKQWKDLHAQLSSLANVLSGCLLDSETYTPQQGVFDFP